MTSTTNKKVHLYPPLPLSLFPGEEGFLWTFICYHINLTELLLQVTWTPTLITSQMLNQPFL